MAYFPRTVYNTEASIAPLFRLFEEIDNQSRRSSRCQARRQAPPAPAAPTAPATPRWLPRFDVRETAGAYYLHGELPGLSKEDISLEFPDHQQLVVRGQTSRRYATPAAPVESVAPAAPAPVAEKTVDDSSSTHSHQATVEDDDSDDESNTFEVIDGTDEKHEAEAESEEDATMSEPEEPQQSAPAPAEKSKYWLKERSIGRFVRGFSFPERIEQDDVTASLQDGILTVTIPKAKKHEPRHVTVN